MFHGCKGASDHFRTIGCLCYAKILPTGDKFIARVVAAVHMGYSNVSKDTTDDVVPVIPSVNTNSAAVEPPINNSSQRDVRHSTRPRKLPSWMNDFITNATSASTPYPLSHTVSYNNLSTQ
ncbi:hypothetical protein KY284_030042 [Solanum tuberosum]|nr:hypothetical protein KY284_030042 [Solanum tuberosum]